jgi:hypothetical protein
MANCKINELIQDLEPVVEAGRDDLVEKIQLAYKSFFVFATNERLLEIKKLEALRSVYDSWLFRNKHD